MFRQVALELWYGVKHLAFPNTCFSCERPLPPAAPPFCVPCAEELTHDPWPKCPRCSSTVGPHADALPDCPNCRGESFAFERVLRLGPYEGRLREMVLRCKFHDWAVPARALGLLWAERRRDQLLAAECDLVVSVPLHWTRRLERGYDQCQAIAGGLAAGLGLPARAHWLRRARATPRQSVQAAAAARRANVAGAFRVWPWARLRGKSVLLVDDVLTSGGTASAAARALRSAGAGRVVVAACAHGHSPGGLAAGVPTA